MQQKPGWTARPTSIFRTVPAISTSGSQFTRTRQGSQHQFWLALPETIAALCTECRADEMFCVRFERLVQQRLAHAFKARVGPRISSTCQETSSFGTRCDNQNSQSFLILTQPRNTIYACPHAVPKQHSPILHDTTMAPQLSPSQTTNTNM